jgi:hypothetical protein
MAVHKDCYTSLKLTQQGGLNRRKTKTLPRDVAGFQTRTTIVPYVSPN